ncbi:MAG: DUF1266 domain-containing protein [Ruminococcus sp.]|nr:DUF1266 domain-containing protein [Ruminococcus sp.]
MANDLTLDENGKVSDGDAIYDDLDKWFDEDEFGKIAEAVLAVPEEQWSVKLRFRLISAYNNMKEFARSREQLVKIQPECKKPDEIARFCYMNGYILFMNDKEMAALAYFENGVAADPDDTCGLDIKSDVKDCAEYVEKDLNELHRLAGMICADVDKRCAQSPQKLKPDDERLALILGSLSAVRKVPGVDKALGTESFFFKFDDSEKKIVAKWLGEQFGIKDAESFKKFYREARGCNISVMFSDIRALFSGKPNFNADELEPGGKRAFFNTCTFVKTFYEFLPEVGVLAWDVSEKIGFCRLAFACGIIPNSDYVSAMLAITDASRKYFDSAAEFVKSLILGSALYMFSLDEWNIKRAISFMRQTATVLFQSPMPDIEWAGSEPKEDDGSDK